MFYTLREITLRYCRVCLTWDIYMAALLVLGLMMLRFVLFEGLMYCCLCVHLATRHEGICVSESRSPFVLNIDTKLIWLVTFTPFSDNITPGIPRVWGWVGPRILLNHWGWQETFVSAVNISWNSASSRPKL